jgi:type IV secretion system protein VirB5
MIPARPPHRCIAAVATTAALFAVAAAIAPAPAAASMPVIDIAALTQLRAQLDAWRTQLAGMERQLTELHAAYAAVTGHRGLQAVLPIAVGARNYLPPLWSGLEGPGGAQYNALGAATRAQQAANSVLSAADVARYPDSLRTLLGANRQAVAGTEVAMRTAYAQSSARFAELERLIDAIGATVDAKGIAELQGRIAAEQAMLANEAIKLFAAGQSASAEAAALDLQRREQIVANHGAFAIRFRPTPPEP